MFNAVFSLQTFEYFLLVLVRVSAFFFVAPFFNTRVVPRKVRVGIAGCISIMLMGVLRDVDYTYTDVIGYSVIVMKEGITGLLIGFSASICNSIVLFAGTIIDMQIGLSMAHEYNPMTQMNESVTGSMYNYLVLLLLLSTGMYGYVVRAICDSYQLLRIDEQLFQWDTLLRGFTVYMSDLLVIGFRIALPVFASMMVTNCILGIMAKVAPQMNMFTVGMQLKLLGGLAIIYVSMTLVPTVADFISDEMKRMILYMIQGMSASG